MRVVVVSDTHGSVEFWMRLERFLENADAIWHLGDVLYHGPRNPLPLGYEPAKLAERLKRFSIDYVRGNCDADVDVMVLGLPEMSRVVEESVGNFKIVMIHGDDLSEEDEEEFTISHKAHILLRGHTHIPRLERKGRIWVVNPGSLSLPKGGSENSFAEMVFDESEVVVRILNLEGRVIMEEVLGI